MIGCANMRLGLIALWCIAGAGCGDVRRDPAEQATTAEPAPASTSVPAPAAPSAPAASAIDSIKETPVAHEPPPAMPSVLTAEVAVAAAEPAIVAPAAPVTQVSETPSVIPTSVASSPSAETLNFTSLVTRLRKTKAINLRTKVAVKGESNELLERFRAYHTQHGTTTLADLRRSYDSLFHELHSLLQDTDPPLARDIDRSRAAIWDVLADPRKFSTSMAGT